VIQKCVPAGHTKATNPLALPWWGLVQKDDFLHNVTLQVAAVDLEWARGEHNAYHSDIYTKHSLHMLRNRIQDTDLGISNETIAAVASLAALEVGTPNLHSLHTNELSKQHGRKNRKACKMHIDGLKRMISLRGGLNDVRKSNEYSAQFSFL